ncbi:hypothetical protein DFJ74DRAFT_650673 [Hyaloraphidium curvatum]|nr:hypothetical protein DFJ74DRAFT_650673 [Hyaloraphidium curvatum]
MAPEAPGAKRAEGARSSTETPVNVTPFNVLVVCRLNNASCLNLVRDMVPFLMRSAPVPVAGIERASTSVFLDHRIHGDIFSSMVDLFADEPNGTQLHRRLLPYVPHLTDLACPDLVIAVGGDGTMLNAAWLFNRPDVALPAMIGFRAGDNDPSRLQAARSPGRMMISDHAGPGRGIVNRGFGGRRGVLAVHEGKRWKETLAGLLDPAATSGRPGLALEFQVVPRTRLMCTLLRGAAWGGPSSLSTATLARRPPFSPPTTSYTTYLTLNPKDPHLADHGISLCVLNDLCIDRGPSSLLLSLDVWLGRDAEGAVERNKVVTVAADGLLFSTPTGSTSYSLSAGGSVVHPRCATSVSITPIAAHELAMRPFVLPLGIDDPQDGGAAPFLEVVVPADAREPADDSFSAPASSGGTVKPVCWASFDSRLRIPLYRNDRIVIRRAKHLVLTIEEGSGTDWGAEQSGADGPGLTDSRLRGERL